jgi:hypothetical protein
MIEKITQEFILFRNKTVENLFKEKGIERPERKERFSRIKMVEFPSDNEEYWFFDNQTENGLFIGGIKTIYNENTIDLVIIKEQPEKLNINQQKYFYGKLIE